MSPSKFQAPLVEINDLTKMLEGKMKLEDAGNVTIEEFSDVCSGSANKRKRVSAEELEAVATGKGFKII